VNNAGGASGFPQGVASIPDEDWQSAIALNLFAAIRLRIPTGLEHSFRRHLSSHSDGT